MYLQSPHFTNTDFTNKSLMPYFDPEKPPKEFKVNLYDYQQRTLAKMLLMEKQMRLKKERKTRLELATTSLEGWSSTN